VRAFTRQAGVSCTDGDSLPRLTGYDAAEGRPLSADEVDATSTMLFETFTDAVDGLRARLGPEASAAAAIEAFVAGAGLAPGPARRARQALRATVEADAADRAERQSLQWLWTELEYDGSYFGDLPDGGYRRVVDAMAGGLDVRLGAVVSEVVRTAAGVEVLLADGTIEAGSHAVVTVPLGVLKSGTPRFSPDLPADRLAAIERIGFGCYEKVVLAFDEPFWHSAGFTHLMLFSADPDEPALFAFDHSALGAGPTLVGHVFPSSVGRVLDRTPDEAAQWVLGLLAEAVGGPCPAPSGVKVTSWGTDPFTAGAYTHIPPGADPPEVNLLGEPVDGRLLFAGEHTQSARLGYADGAMTSGIREAKRLLAQPSVLLGPVDGLP
jgi:polyamine oxidase